uniref:Uncharacterized protein n=1 Tax=Pelagomonas calceolata TaxID=35677 RepID=A0A7S3ZWJ2_9STRA|mmetsp:Transcript_21640/g.56507  ORF Transcript_21640/g.56507 Transcript_21640/m.56507 type:complete len:179 (+) Transcript_21640:137-673(+)
MASAAPAADGGTARARRAADDKAESALQDKLVKAVTCKDVSDAAATAAIDAAFGGGGAERRAGLGRLAAALSAEVRDKLEPAVEAELKRRAAPKHPGNAAWSWNAAKASTPVATPTSSPVQSDDDEANGSGPMDDGSATSPARVALKARPPPARTPQSASGDARRVKPDVPGLQIPEF